ncbi:hypothetical protein UK23_43665 [Lentzea aerocolonigenes]|uniref:Uncharacterized protein n=1 Tax=Lentzea aerocolonigenes TaxID=68170 RepID=A0A0F0GGY8_LENAE|nr:hypothetical protein [Lentzea aerocolonigenes]KJK34388.1 hypothetical protein UK23_43665 [Lentzea aerocolonigenes]
MEPDPKTPSGSRWEPGTTTTAEPPPAPPVQHVKPARRLTGPIIAGALGLAVLTGAGGFALGYAVSDNGANQVRQDDQRPGRFPGGRQGRGDGRFGTPPGEQDGQSNGQGT